MRITKESLFKLIKEEVENTLDTNPEEEEEAEPSDEQAKLGKSSMTKSDVRKDLRTQRQNVGEFQGITNVERAIIQDFVKTLKQAAEVTNIKTGGVFSLLNRVNKMMKKFTEQEKEDSSEQ
tara:strand:+ start:955 stop:1317 length:363 start_codon:yes stop_codon:yes gene_type:complete